MRSLVAESGFAAMGPVLTSLRNLGWDCRRLPSLDSEDLFPYDLLVLAVGPGGGAEPFLRQLETVRPAARTMGVVDRAAADETVKPAAERCDEFALW